MSRNQATVGWLVVLLVCAGIGILLPQGHAQNAATPAVETLLPAGSILYFGCDGSASHQAAWQATAAYESLYQSGLADVCSRLLTSLFEQSGKNAEVAAAQETLLKGFNHISENGVSLAVSLPGGGGPPLPQVTLVLRNGAPLQDGIAGLLKQAAGRKTEFTDRKIGTRNVTSATVQNRGAPPVEIGWWAEGKHLVFAAGVNAIQPAIDVASGESPNITAGRLWKKYADGQRDKEFEVSSTVWLDFAALRDALGPMPLPVPPNANPVTANDLLDALGLGNLGACVVRSGYHGRALWSESLVEAPGPRKGLLALSDQTPITLDDRPPLPSGTNGFYLCSLDWSKLYDDVVQLLKNVPALASPDAAAQVEGAIAQLPAIIGFDPKTDLLDPLGSVTCLYSDPGQGFFGFGGGLAIKVDDAPTLRKTVDTIVAMAEESSRGDFSVRRVEKQGREILTFEFNRRVSIGALTVDDGWLVLALAPQSVEGFLLRLDRKLPSWTPSADYQKGLAELPKEFTSLSAADPRSSMQAILGFAPAILMFVETGLKEQGIIPRGEQLPVSVADIPPAEVVTRPLFPNICVCTVDDEGIHWTSRTSLPAIPFVTGVGGGSGVATTGVLVALLLPAVQSAREAARRTQSQNNMKQLGLALHNYHEAHGSLPRGTLENEKLKPEERLSWLVSILPYVDQQPLYERINRNEAWDSDDNRQWLQNRFQLLLNPGIPVEASEYGQTHYVGIAGLGEDGPTLPVNDKRAGVFGYNRVTRFRDIIDGTSNTVMISEASKDFGPWGAGGKSTIRALTKKPYLNGPDGIGGPYRGVTNMGFADGSVRSLNNAIDPKILEAISTIRGGEVVGGY